MQATIELSMPGGRNHPIGLRARKDARDRLVGAPACDRGALIEEAPNLWMVPTGCSRVSWIARLDDYDAEGGDAAYPVGLWSRRLGVWTITNRLPWLSNKQLDQTAEVEGLVRARSGRITKSSFVPPRPGRPPFYAILSTKEPALFLDRGLTLGIHGDPPAEASAAMQQRLVQIWSQWVRDVLPPDVTAPARLDMIWMPPLPKAQESGFFASAGTSAVVMQVTAADGAAEAARFRAAFILIGAHEGFHSLIGSMGQTWPAWVNESWASFFAYRAARLYLDPLGLSAADELINQKSDLSLLEGQAKYAAGDGAQTGLFYGKGARFWSAIEDVLTTRKNASGRLAALIQDSRGFSSVDWTNPESLADFLDARSKGRASAIVRCYLQTSSCG